VTGYWEKHQRHLLVQRVPSTSFTLCYSSVVTTLCINFNGFIQVLFISSFRQVSSLKRGTIGSQYGILACMKH